MSRRKIKRFEEMKTFSNTFEYPVEIKGRWHSDVFKNSNPIVLELGCGEGEYPIGMSAIFPERNFIGIDLKGSRLWKGARYCIEAKQANAAFIRSRIEVIDTYFEPGEIDEIWITFPDPQPRDKWEKKRLTSGDYLSLYNRILKPGGYIHLKTDNVQLYEYTLDLLKTLGHTIIFHHQDIYSLFNLEPEMIIETTFEKKFKEMGEKIKYIRFQLKL